MVKVNWVRIGESEQGLDKGLRSGGAKAAECS
jgi:hypothetical protein